MANMQMPSMNDTQLRLAALQIADSNDRPAYADVVAAAEEYYKFLKGGSSSDNNDS